MSMRLNRAVKALICDGRAINKKHSPRNGNVCAGAFSVPETAGASLLDREFRCKHSAGDNGAAAHRALAKRLEINEPHAAGLTVSVGVNGHCPGNR
jgi:hypothetical protein